MNKMLYATFWAQEQEADPWRQYCRSDDRYFIDGSSCEAFDIAALYERAFAVAHYAEAQVIYRPRAPLPEAFRP